MIIKLKKTKELEDAVIPNNINIGYDVSVRVNPESFQKPVVGKKFRLTDNKIRYGFITSVVTEIINDTTFKTENSIYQWQIVEE